MVWEAAEALGNQRVEKQVGQGLFGGKSLASLSRKNDEDEAWMTGPPTQLKTLGLDPVVCGETDLVSRTEWSRGPRGQWSNVGECRHKEMGLHWGASFGGMEGARAGYKAQTVGCTLKESNGLGNIPSNLLAFISQAHKNARINYVDMGIVDILHKLSQSPDSNLCDKWVSKLKVFALGYVEFFDERV